MVKCAKFDSTKWKHTLPEQRDFDQHIVNINQFISIKCCYDTQLEREFVKQFSVSSKWKPDILSILRLIENLDAKQTIMDFLKSGQSLRVWSDGNAARNKILGAKIIKNRNVVIKVRKEQEMKTGKCQYKSLQIRKAKINIDANKY